MSDLNIYQRINAVMKDCEYLQKKQAQQGKGIKYDEVMAMLRAHLINHGVVMVVNQLSMNLIGGLDGKNQKIYQGHYTMELVNIDNPSEVVKHSVFAQGMDGGDKGPGKAHTYAMKAMLVKGFGLETGEDEESRSEKIDNQNTISGDQFNELARYCLSEDKKEWTELGGKMARAYKLSSLVYLPASKYNEALARCKAAK